MSSVFFISVLFCVLLGAEIYDYDIKPSAHSKSGFMKINILDSKELKFADSEINELSAIAYEQNRLYALSDKAVLYSFDIRIKDDKIERVFLKNSVKLTNSDGKRVGKHKRDSEGLAFMDDNLLISFERKPRIEVFSKNGKRIKNVKINKDLLDIKNYKDENKALESVAYNKEYGVLSAPESPLKGSKKGIHTLYAKNKKWEFPAQGEISALEFMNKEEIMILQRDSTLMSLQRIAVISRLNLKNNDYEVLAVFDTKDGWKIDNFEGLAKVDEKKYLIISDNQNSIFQKTLLVLFEVP